MKAFAGKLKELFAVLKAFYNRHTIRRAAITILVAAVVIYCLASIPAWTLKSEKIASTSSTPAAEGISEIAADAGSVVVAENGGVSLSIDTESLIITVKDSNNGTTFTSAANASSGSELALLTLTFLGDDNNLTEWNSYDYCVAYESYTLYQIEDGVRIDMNLNDGDSSNFYEYLPKKMSPETYEEVFVAGINQAVEDGTISEETGTRYLTTLGLVYNRSLTEECYAVTYTGNPPASATNQLIAVTQLVGYTTEDLLNDADTFGFTVTFTEPAEFDLTLELTLSDTGELVAHVPTSSIVSYNDYYTAQLVTLLPNFGSATVAEYEDGTFLVPDGSGALVAFNSFISNVTDYRRPFYDNDYFSDFSYAYEYGEELMMPVFGAMYGSEEAREKGFFAIVESGSRNAYLTVKLASAGADSAKYNKIYASFEVAQYKKVKIDGEYSESSGTYLVNTGEQDLDLTVRYQFYGSDVTYFAMAKGYRAYLSETEGLTVSYDEGEAELYLEVMGGLNIASRFVGIPYSKSYSMTSYEELLEIMEDLSGISYQMQYNGAFNGGYNGELNRGASNAGQNGSVSELKKALEYASEENVVLYLQVALSQIWESGNGFRASLHAIRDYSNEAVELSRYHLSLGILATAVNDGISHDDYYLLSPKYLSAVTDSFLKNAGDYSALAISDLAGMYYADYRTGSFISGEMGNTVIEENLEKLSDGRQLALTDPAIDKIGYGTVATDISRESSDYATFETTIPFKQLVMNGLIDYTTEDINLSSRSTAYYVLQAAETGAIPKYILTYKNVDVLKDSDFSYLYSTQYSLLSDEVKEVYAECAEIRSQIGTSEITDHTVIEDGVYETVYASGVVVTVNYNLYDVTLPDGTVLASEAYLIQ